MTAISVPRRHADARAKTRAVDWRARYFNWFCGSVLVVFAAIWIIPLLWALDTSLKPDAVIAAGLLIPSQVLIIPQFNEFNFAHLLNTYWVQVLPAVAVPIAVIIFVTFFTGIPASLAEAARVDGASWWRIYRAIYMPLSKPAISAVFIFTFVWKWNDFLWPLLTLTSTRVMTLPVGLSQVSSAFGIQYAEIMASAVLGALPLIVVFLLFQRQIVEGIATTGIK